MTGGNKLTHILSQKENDLLKSILQTLDERSRYEVIYPKPENVFRALDNLDNAKVVILGQDPYYRPNQANGLAFAVEKDVSMPPSLINIFKELYSEIGDRIETDQTLVSWANQGVILLNTFLSVAEGKPGSHSKLGWHKITNKVIKWLSDTKQNLVFVLWGKSAQAKAALIDDTKHLIISSPHPSPLSAYTGFFGSKPFSKVNQYLISHNIEPVRW